MSCSGNVDLFKKTSNWSIKLSSSWGECLILEAEFGPGIDHR